MLRKTVVVHIPNEHLNNAATFFIKKANEFTSHITVSRKNNSVNAKSLLGLLSMRLEYGQPWLYKKPCLKKNQKQTNKHRRGR